MFEAGKIMKNVLDIRVNEAERLSKPHPPTPRSYERNAWPVSRRPSTIDRAVGY